MSWSGNYAVYSFGGIDGHLAATPHSRMGRAIGILPAVPGTGTLRRMSSPASLESFERELHRLVAKFEKEFTAVTDPGYSEARLRQDYLDPFIRALGWDLENHAGLIQHHREVEIESRTDVAGRAKRADYLFRTDTRDRFICEAKKPRVTLGPRDAFQAKRYAWNKKVHLALLTDFEDLKIFLVGGKPHKDLPDVGLWKSWHFKQYPLVAAEIWQLLARENVAAGSIESAIDKLPKRAPTGRGKARQLYLIKPDRTRELDTDFLEFLDEARRELAGDILRHNDRADILADGRLNEAVQSILDRLLFIRICEDRDIDTGTRLQSIVETWQRAWDRDDGKKHRQEHLRISEEPPDMDGAGGGGGRSRLPRESLWRAVVTHLRALDRRPPSHVPFFNGNLFKPHFSEDLLLGDTWLAEFIGELSDDESPYLFNIIPVEILGSVYERFLGKVVRPHGRGVTIEEKPEVRKAGGVYYTPRYIVDYIVEQTVGRQLEAVARVPGRVGVPPAAPGILPGGPSARGGASIPNPAPSKSEVRAGGTPAPAGGTPTLPGFPAFERATRALRLLDPACGSGSFLIRAFERVCEHWQRRFTRCPDDRRAELCWVDPATGDVHLTVGLKRRILRDNIYGVDLDAQAVEVTQLSLYLKMLEGEDRTTLQRQRELFKDEPALLPPLQDNIKCGNSLIASDFSLVPEDLLRVNAFDWETGFREIMKAGGFDAVIGNPPYVLMQMIDDRQGFDYLSSHYRSARYKIDTYQVFMERGLSLCRLGGRFGFITPSSFMRNKHAIELRSVILESTEVASLRVFYYSVFRGASVDTCILVAERINKPRANATIQFIKSKAPATSDTSEGSQQKWLEHPARNFQLPSDGGGEELIAKVDARSSRLGEIATAYFGIQTFDRNKFVSGRKEAKHYKPVVDGLHIHRYDLLPGSEFVDFQPRAIKSGGNDLVYEQERVGVRQIGRTPIGSILPKGLYALNTIYNIYFTADTKLDLRFVLGLLSSALHRWYWVQQFFDQKETFPKIKKDALLSIPIPRLDMKLAADKKHHDALVSLVDKMLALVPKLRAATSEKERAVLQNAVASTDRKIDDLVYALYALTPEEIALVEGGK